MTPTDPAIRHRLSQELADVESRFTAELVSDLACVNDLVAHVEQYRGKMLRPTLVLVSAMACDPRQELREAHRIIATVCEMVHMATLVHDDILDEADVRRHGATVNHLRGNETAVMLGDYLISHAYHLCSSIDRPAISRIIADATNTVCEGELLQLANRNNWVLDEKTYFEIIRRKTASLCGTCCSLAAILHKSPTPVVQALYDYGEKVGIAFQIIDDVLDLVGVERTVGKTLGRDIQKGKLTLPLIRQIASLPAIDRDNFLAILREQAVNEVSPAPAAPACKNNGNGAWHGKDIEQHQFPADGSGVEGIRNLIVAGGAIERARGTACKLIEEAKAALGILPQTDARALLEEMADAVITRQF